MTIYCQLYFIQLIEEKRWSEFILPVEEDWEKSTDVQVQLHATNMDSIWIVLSRKLASNKFEHNLYYLKTKGKLWKIIKEYKY